VTTAGALVAAVVAMLLGACAQEADDSGATDLDPASAMVEYRYNDSSVPPEYHRSYTITVREGEARMATDAEHPASEPALRVRAEVCGGGGEGGADADAIDAAIEPVLALFDTDELLATD
jgi:hypothetical protein